MDYGLMLTIGSFIFVLILMVMYFSNTNRTNELTSLIYKILLIITMFMIISEIFSVLYLKYYGSNTITNILFRIHWFFGILLFPSIYYYFSAIVTETTETNFFKYLFINRRITIITILFIIMGIVFFFLPFSALDSNNINYFPGLAAYFVYVVGAFSGICIVYDLVINRGFNSVRTKFSVIFFVCVCTAIVVFQYYFTNVAFSPIAVSILIYMLYFTLENPDLKLIKNIKLAKDEIDRSNRAKNDFLSNMTHEIRTPLNAIVGFSETLINSPMIDESSTRSDIESIEKSSNNLLDIINNILDISKIETADETLDLREYLLSDIILELESIIDSRIGLKPVKLILEVDPNISKKFLGDATKIHQILLNILTNSVKYTEVGKINLIVTSVKNNNIETLTFKISDTGYGIKKEDFDKLFQKFSRLDSAVKNEIEGTGLGLVITKRYVELMGGKIWFESDYGVGTSFYVEINQKIIDNTPIGNINDINNSLLTNTQKLDCSKFNALVVDDNELNVKVACRLLGAYKFNNIDTVPSGRDCIYKIKSDNHYDIIFMDDVMSDLDGIETLHVVKKLNGLYDIPPVVALTANAVVGVKEIYLKEGFDEYLSKPISVQELDKVINKLFYDKK